MVGKITAFFCLLWIASCLADFDPISPDIGYDLDMSQVQELPIGKLVKNAARSLNTFPVARIMQLVAGSSDLAKGFPTIASTGAIMGLIVFGIIIASTVFIVQNSFTGRNSRSTPLDMLETNFQSVLNQVTSSVMKAITTYESLQ